jgi:hypothetical protein
MESTPSLVCPWKKLGDMPWLSGKALRLRSPDEEFNVANGIAANPLLFSSDVNSHSKTHTLFD